MAPAQNMEIENQNNDKYTHKKFKGKRIYAHKKFGTCLSSTPPKDNDKSKKTISTGEENATKNVPPKHSCKDLFRPYALPDNAPRKRKYRELQGGYKDEASQLEFKKFAYSDLPAPLTPSHSQPIFPALNAHFINPPAMPFNPYYRLQQYHFNPQMLALILQKQRTALYLGEILKRQGNLNSYNLIGE